MKIVIDRFEGDFAVCLLQDKTTVNVPAILFPDACEGDIIDIVVNKQQTQKEKQALRSRLEGLFDN